MNDGPVGGRQRLFVAVPVPAESLDHVEAVQHSLPRVRGLRLLKAEQLHVTLAFIGEVDDGKAEAARSVVEGIPATMGGTAQLGGAVFFPSANKARVVALEVIDTRELFAALFVRVMGGLEAARVMQREKRPFRAHVTIARIKVPGPVQPMAESGPVRFAVESVCLYESELRREGAVYAVRTRRALLDAEAREKA